MENLKNYFVYAFDFVGVCARKEFWITFGYALIFYLACAGFLFLGAVMQFLSLILILALTVPTLSLFARRLHDTDRSAWNLLYLLIPIVGLVVICVFCLEKTKYFI